MANFDSGANTRKNSELLKIHSNASQITIIQAILDSGANTREFRTFRNPLDYKPSPDNKANLDSGANTRNFRSCRNSF